VLEVVLLLGFLSSLIGILDRPRSSAMKPESSTLSPKS
jgi:hypothetical protein